MERVLGIFHSDFIRDGRARMRLAPPFSAREWLKMLAVQKERESD